MPPSISRLSDMNNCNPVAVAVMPPEPLTIATSSLKRKRPPKIEIPNVLQEIGSDAAVKLTPKNSGAVLSSSGFGVGVCSVKGKKLFMEDTHKIVSSSNSDKRFFGVYDGHGGRKAAEFVENNLHSNVFEMLEKCSGITTKEEAIKAGFLKTDEEFLKQGLESGTCCVTVLIEEKEVVIANVGDCRAVLSTKGKAEALTKDHRASDKDERERIEKKGGYVERRRGTWRVHGVLSVSRSIGDAHLKDWVLAEPETKSLPLTADMEYLILASDGLWDEVRNQEAIDVVMNFCSVEKKIGLVTGDSGMVKNDEYGCVRTAAPKLKKLSTVKQKKARANCLKGSENYLGCEDDSPPPCKARRISLLNQMKAKTQNANQENCNIYEKTIPSRNGLVDACKELVNLAVSRGSLDDITVMIVDLRAFH